MDVGGQSVQCDGATVLAPIGDERQPSLATGERAMLHFRVRAIAGVAAVTYLSWPLGYLVNRAVVEGGLASDLEVPGQPYSWVFVLLDIFSGALIVAVVLLVRSEPAPGRHRGLAAYAVFGLSTAASAALPLRCGQGMRALLACGTSTNRYDVHDLLSLIGYFALFVSLVGAEAGSGRWRAAGSLAGVTLMTGCLWSLCGLVLITAVLAHWSQALCQHVFLILTSGLIALIPAMVTSDAVSRCSAVAAPSRGAP